MKTFKYFTEAKMTRQHFQLIADVIASLELMKSNKDLVARKFATALESTNPGFKADTFMKASIKKSILISLSFMERFGKMLQSILKN